MPVHEISVVPAMKKNTSNGSSRTREKSKENETEKAPARSWSRSSNISKASSSTQGLTLNGASRTSVTPSNQDICSPGVLVKLEKDISDQTAPTMTLSNAPNPAPVAKRQVKRRHRRPRESSRRGGVARCVAKCAEQLKGPHTHDLAPYDSSSEDERQWRQARSWSREKARRRHTRTMGGPEDPPNREKPNSQKEKRLPEGDGMALGSVERSPRSREHRESMLHNDRRGSGCGNGGGSEEEVPITRSHEEQGLGKQDMAVLTAQKYTSTSNQNGTIQHACSDDDQELCRICHCEGDEECALITPCRCTGSLRFVHQSCLNQWIKSSDTRCCELCKYEFIMEAHLKPLCKWEKLQMSSSEQRKIFCSVIFHLVAVACVIWSLYILIHRTAEEIRQGKNNEVLEWPFWTKLTVVALSFAGGLIFMYIQCKVYLQLWRRLKAFNRVIFVQNCPDSVCRAGEKAPPPPGGGDIHEATVFPALQTQTGISCPTPPGDAAVAPV